MLHTLFDLETEENDIKTFFKEAKENEDDELFELAYDQSLIVLSKIDEFENEVLLNGPFDNLNAIVEIHPGAGGVEAHDWADMLSRMYLRWSELHNYKVEILDYLAGEEAGIKSITFEVKGENVYGLLKGEKGVHRLVRISPFDANSRRHTSFASVDVTPIFEEDVEIEIKNEDLRIDTYRASGAGGQHINKTDSAVRITHLPTGIVTTCQNQRSQMQNKEYCMMMLKSKLYEKAIEDKNEEMSKIKGEQKANEWGSQIRSYVFCPYTLVKDNRTNYSTGDVSSVMDGKIDDFISAYLRLK